MEATNALAVTGPTPGMVARRWLTGFDRCQAWRRLSAAHRALMFLRSAAAFFAHAGSISMRLRRRLIPRPVPNHDPSGGLPSR